MFSKKEIGDIGERAAACFLKKNKYKILCRNYRKPYGEIDIIAKRGDCIFFVEVKTRKNADFANACEFVTSKKQERIIKTAMAYLCEEGIDPAISFDIIEVYFDDKKVKAINHITNAFGG